MQALQLAAHLAAGEALAGWKVDLTHGSRAVQRTAGPLDRGFILASQVQSEGVGLAATDFIAPKIEPEAAVLLERDLPGPGITVENVMGAVGAVYPAMEVIDSRIADWDLERVDAVADNALCAAIVVGDVPFPVTLEDLSLLSCTLVIDGHPAERGRAEDLPFGDLLTPVVWLANQLVERGAPLQAGQLVLPGSLTKAMPVLADSTAMADFGVLGSLTVAVS
ncbi:MAG: 2-oxopent-4-enoate hydratase [Arthrobacter sp.]